MAISCKSLTFVELFCCLCGSVFILAISGSTMYMIYFQYNPKWNSEVPEKPDNFGIRSSLRSEPRSKHHLTTDFQNGTRRISLKNKDKTVNGTQNSVIHATDLLNIRKVTWIILWDLKRFSPVYRFAITYWLFFQGNKRKRKDSFNSTIHSNQTCIYLHFNCMWKYLLLWEMLMILVGLFLICT